MNQISNFNPGRIAAQTLVAAMFLSRLPLDGLVARIGVDKDADFSQTTRYFGLAAIIVALPATLVLWAAMSIDLPIPVSAILAIVALVLTTGALHEDALADVADGFGGGKTVEDKLAIMRDSQIGTYGACALVLSFALQLALLIALIERVAPTYAPLILIFANVISTVLMLGPWVAFDPARSGDGLSISHGLPTMGTMATAIWSSIPLALVLGWMVFGIYPILVALTVSISAAAAFSVYCNNKIGGHTGDTLGATRKISELALLLALVVVT